ncbi:hypothetical protein FRACA_1370015 [Frankia canadensis]|uniref:Uncharacterized protein n=1 Tax=Frankia canadensis TaxID=1836972 RepID=A0A2I2KL34_9ACTN|nr:hypothetical protein [Frankia canadensis]SNQ46356.1 hypothetical protein FRACA_1370015 [Frankia canadensis]SOU53646.1 hypothetical protein FRACA_1370015 [Frankia canadensis]
MLTGRDFFPHLLAGPFHHGLMVVFGVAAGLGVLAGLASQLRGALPKPPQTQGAAEVAVAAELAVAAVAAELAVAAGVDELAGVAGGTGEAGATGAAGAVTGAGPASREDHSG